LRSQETRNLTNPGADLLASAGYRVVMPDFLKGAYAEGSMFDGTPEGDAKKIAYITGPGKPDSEGQAVAIAAALAALKAQGYASVGTVGFCWGWKAAITAKDVNQFSAIAGVHPS
jgi:dienelactone hydrolase